MSQIETTLDLCISVLVHKMTKVEEKLIEVLNYNSGELMKAGSDMHHYILRGSDMHDYILRRINTATEDVKADMYETSSDMKAGFVALDDKIVSVETDMKIEFERLNRKVDKVTAQLDQCMKLMQNVWFWLRVGFAIVVGSQLARLRVRVDMVVGFQ